MIWASTSRSAARRRMGKAGRKARGRALAKRGENPQVVVIAGPNGAGKSTSAARVLRGTFAVSEFVNADVIARGLSEFNPEAVAMTAGKMMLQRLHTLAEGRQNFAFETTLASRSFAPWIRLLREQGYKFHLVFFWLPVPELSIARVKERVARGGHHVPDETIRRRFYGGIYNFFELYRPLADTWRWYNNAVPPRALLVASGGIGRRDKIYNHQTWATIQAQANTARDRPSEHRAAHGGRESD